MDWTDFLHVATFKECKGFKCGVCLIIIKKNFYNASGRSLSFSSKKKKTSTPSFFMANIGYFLNPLSCNLTDSDFINTMFLGIQF